MQTEPFEWLAGVRSALLPVLLVGLRCDVIIGLCIRGEGLLVSFYETSIRNSGGRCSMEMLMRWRVMLSARNDTAVAHSRALRD